MRCWLQSITELLCAVSCNAHTICDEEIRPIGKGLYLGVAMVNHSCVPNASLIFEGVTGVRTTHNVTGLCFPLGILFCHAQHLKRNLRTDSLWFICCWCTRGWVKHVVCRSCYASAFETLYFPGMKSSVLTRSCWAVGWLNFERDANSTSWRTCSTLSSAGSQGDCVHSRGGGNHHHVRGAGSADAYATCRAPRGILFHLQLRALHRRPGRRHVHGGRHAWWTSLQEWGLRGCCP